MQKCSATTPRGHWLVVVLTLACVSAQPACQRGTGAPSPPPPTARAWPTAVAEKDLVGPAHLAVGRVAFDENHTQHVGVPVDGRVVRLAAQLGDRVQRGQILFTLRSPAVAAMHGELRKVRQDVALAAREVQRLELLHADGATSERELLAARSGHAKAQAEQEQLNATLGNLGLSAQAGGLEVNIVARVDGTVVERRVLVGQEVRADDDQVLMVVSNLQNVWVIADIYEADLAAVDVGRKVMVTTSAYPQAPHSGTVAYVGDIIDPTSRTVKVRCEVPNAAGRLKPEMFVQVAIDTPAVAGVWVPPAAVVLRGQQAAVWLPTPQGPTRQVVVPGRVVGGRQHIIEGLAAGQQVIAEGALFLDRTQEP